MAGGDVDAGRDDQAIGVDPGAGIAVLDEIVAHQAQLQGAVGEGDAFGDDAGHHFQPRHEGRQLQLRPYSA